MSLYLLYLIVLAAVVVGWIVRGALEHGKVMCRHALVNQYGTCLTCHTMRIPQAQPAPDRESARVG